VVVRKKLYKSINYRIDGFAPSDDLWKKAQGDAVFGGGKGSVHATIDLSVSASRSAATLGGTESFDLENETVPGVKRNDDPDDTYYRTRVDAAVPPEEIDPVLTIAFAREWDCTSDEGFQTIDIDSELARPRDIYADALEDLDAASSWDDLSCWDTYDGK